MEHIGTNNRGAPRDFAEAIELAFDKKIERFFLPLQAADIPDPGRAVRLQAINPGSGRHQPVCFLVSLFLQGMITSVVKKKISGMRFPAAGAAE